MVQRARTHGLSYLAVSAREGRGGLWRDLTPSGRGKIGMKRIGRSGNSKDSDPGALPTPDISRMSYNPANFAYWIREEPWVTGYSVWYAISFYDAVTGVESARSDW